MGLIYKKKFICDNIKREEVLYKLINQLIDEYQENEDVLNDIYSSILKVVCEYIETEKEAKELIDKISNDEFDINEKNISNENYNFIDYEKLKYIPSLFIFSSIIIYFMTRK